MVELLIFDAIIVGIPLLTYFFPPKSRYAVYGYRTPRAFKSEENWHFAQRFFARRWILVPGIVIVSQLILLLAGIPVSGEPPLIPLISLGEFLLGSVICMMVTEVALKKFEHTPQERRSPDG